MLLKHEFVILFVFIIATLVPHYLEGRPRTNNTHRNKQVLFSRDNGTQIEIISNSSLHGKNKSEIRILTRGADGYITDFSDQDIIFPDTYQIIFESSFKVHGPPKCAEAAGTTTFCEDYTNYPNDRIKDILKRKQVRHEFFGQDEIPEDGKINISNRIGEEEEFLCTSLQKTIFPKIGQTKNNKWKFIINQNDHNNNNGYVQGVRVEMCSREGGTCNLISDLPTGYSTYCKQKYIYRRLLSVSEDGEPIPDSFLFPSACCCAYKRDVGFLSRSRIGLPVTPARKKFFE